MSENTPLSCGCGSWEHDLFDGQCPPREPASCCGVIGIDGDVRRPCVNGLCTEWFCQCGVYTQMSAGLVGCDCSEQRSASRVHGEQRRRTPVPASRAHHRRYRSRGADRYRQMLRARARVEIVQSYINDRLAECAE